MVTKLALILGGLFYIFSAFFFSPMFLMGVILMPLAVHIWLGLLAPIVYGSIVPGSMKKE